MKKSTAIVCFAFNRPRHLRITLKALSLNPEANTLPLYLYVDGPRTELDQYAITKIIELAEEFKGVFRSFELRAKSVNIGLYDSLTSGITDLLEEFDRLVVLEDDICVSSSFLNYMLLGLDKYQDNQQVASIHGYTPPISSELPDSFFLRGADCWGWATWKDQWKYFRHDAQEMLVELRDQGLINYFDLFGAYPYSKLLEARAKDQSSSWAICWHAACFLANKRTLYPGRSLVQNIGLDSTGEHCSQLDHMIVKPSNHRVSIYPDLLDVKPEIFTAYCKYFFAQQNSSVQYFQYLRRKIVNSLRRLYSNIVVTKQNKQNKNQSPLRTTGPYPSYEYAASLSTGYSDSVIIDKVKQATLALLERKAVYERDGTAFKQRPNPLRIREKLSSLLMPKTTILDVGGSLGSLWLNNQDLFTSENQYIVLEQESFVSLGKQICKDFNLPLLFISSLDELKEPIDWAVFSGVLPYLADSKKVVHSILKLDPEIIIIDRQPFSCGASNECNWWIQHEDNYYCEPISYPYQLLSYEHLLNLFPTYKVLDSWTNDFDPIEPVYKGLILTKK